MHVGIVGHEKAKFTEATEQRAREIIRELLAAPDAVLVSGGCHLGGIDIWAEEEYAALPDRVSRPDPIIHHPRVLNWSQGFQPRNIRIAKDSDVVHCIVVTPFTISATFHGPLYRYCYHCHTTSHIKSGGCWTAKYAERLGKPAVWHELW